MCNNVDKGTLVYKRALRVDIATRPTSKFLRNLSLSTLGGWAVLSHKSGHPILALNLYFSLSSSKCLLEREEKSPDSVLSRAVTCDALVRSQELAAENLNFHLPQPLELLHLTSTLSLMKLLYRFKRLYPFLMNKYVLENSWE